MKLTVKEFLNAVLDEIGLARVTIGTPIELIQDAIKVVYTREGYALLAGEPGYVPVKSAVFYPQVDYSMMIKSEYEGRTVRESTYNHFYLQCMLALDLGKYNDLAKFAEKCLHVRKELKRQIVKSTTDMFFLSVLKCAVNMVYIRLPHELRREVTEKARETIMYDMNQMQQNGAKILCYDCDEIVYIGDVQKLSFEQHDEVLRAITFTINKGAIKQYADGRVQTRHIVSRVKPWVIDSINSQAEKTISL